MGLDGTIGDNWDWEVGYNYGEVTNSQVGRDINQLNFKKATYVVVDAQTGEYRCADPAFVEIGCVPTDVFSPFNNEQMKFWSSQTTLDGKLEEQILSGSVSNSSLFSLPAGDVGFAAGIEHRREYSEEFPDSVTASGMSGGLQIDGLQGEYEVDEAFVEFEVPVLSGIDVLWNEYQVHYLQNVLGLSPPFPTPVLGYRNFAIDEGVTISTDATDIGIWGEGVDKLIDNNVTIKFNAVIEMPWWIPEHAPDLMPINEVDAVAVDVVLPKAQVLHKYSVSTGNDNPLRAPTTWTVSGSQDGQNWTQLGEDSYPQAPERLTTYHFDVVDNLTAFNYYRFVFDNAQEGDGIGGDNGRLVQIGELALLTEQP